MLIIDVGEDGSKVVRTGYRGVKSGVFLCELVFPLAWSQEEWYAEERWEMPFLFASGIYGFGDRSYVTNAQGEGIYWVLTMMDDTFGLKARTAVTNLTAIWQLTSCDMPCPSQETWVCLTPLFFKFIFNWRIIALPYSDINSLCHTATWISCGYTCVPSVLNLQSPH